MKIPSLCFSGRLVAISLLAITACADPGLPVKPAAKLGFDTRRLERIPAMLKREIDAGRYAGAIWLVARDGAVVSHGVLGLSDVATRKPLTEDTLVRIYSMSKIVTSVTALTLLEEGLINLDDRVDKYLPEFAKMKVVTGGTVDAPELVDAKRPITLRHLFTHTSGLVYDFSASDPLKTLWRRQELWKAPSLREAVRRTASLPLAHQPGDKWTYGVNTDVLGAVIEAVTGQDLETVMRARVFAPLGMTRTTFQPGAAALAQAATIHHRTKDGRLERDAEWMDLTPLPFPSGGGGLFSTLHDYARFAQMLLNGGELDGKRVLGRKTVELMTDNHIPHLKHGDGSPRWMGLGVGVRTVDQAPANAGSFGTYGWSGAASTDVDIDPRERLVTILLLQHAPFNEDNIFERFANTVYQALK